MRAIASWMLVTAASIGVTQAQTSASFKLVEHVFNTGGDPLNGSFAASASHRLRLDALGDGPLAPGSSSAGFQMDSGFALSYPPPGEVLNLRWTGPMSMEWDPEKSVGAYALYRDLVTTLPGGFGTCFQSGITDEAWITAEAPPAGRAWFYLVTARNRLGEEGTKGSMSNGTERSNPSPCP